MEETLSASSYRVATVPIELLFTEDFSAVGKSVVDQTEAWERLAHTWSDLPLSRFWPYTRLFDYFRLGKPGAYRSYIERWRQIYSNRNLPLPMTPTQQLAYRHEHFRKMERNFWDQGYAHPDFVFDAIYVQGQNKFMQLDGHHRSTFLRSMGARRLLVKISCSDYDSWRNEHAASRLRTFISQRGIGGFYTPVLHPDFFHMSAERDFSANSRLDKILEYLGPKRLHGPIVDIGSGHGLFSHHFIREGVSVAAFERDRDHFDLTNLLSDLYEIQLNSENLGFEDASNNQRFSGALLLTVLYHAIERGNHLRLLHKIDDLVEDFVVWESGHDPETEKAEIIKRTRFTNYQKIAETYGTGRIRELGFFSTPYFSETVW